MNGEIFEVVDNEQAQWWERIDCDRWPEALLQRRSRERLHGDHTFMDRRAAAIWGAAISVGWESTRDLTPRPGCVDDGFAGREGVV
jgi:hypothetical protein